MTYATDTFSNSLLAFPEPLYKVFHDSTLYGEGTRSEPLRVVGGGGGTWGSITGTLSSQTDLQTALDNKLSTSSFVPAGLLTPTYMALAVGGGAVVGRVFFDGTIWTT
jgi:hypothetical protein